MIPTLLALLLGCDEEPVDDGENAAPVASAALAGEAIAGAPVRLTGVASYDPEGAPLTWHWSLGHLPAESASFAREAVFTPNHASTSEASFTPDVPGLWLVHLRVHDGAHISPAHTLAVQVEPTELAPTAQAGADLTVRLGEPVSLSGAASSDPRGLSLGYAWALTETPAGSVLADTTTDTPNFTWTPDRVGTWVAELSVTNGQTRSLPDAVVVTVLGEGVAPVADAGADAQGEACARHLLDGSASSDADGSALVARWEVQDAPVNALVSLEVPSALSTAFFAPAPGAYAFTLSVFNGWRWSEPDWVLFDAAARQGNQPPAVSSAAPRDISLGEADCDATYDGWELHWSCDACADLTFSPGEGFQFTDADGDVLTARWSSNDPNVRFLPTEDPAGLAVLSGFTPTEGYVCYDRLVTFEVEVSDCPGATAQATTAITFTCCGTE